MIRSSDCVGCMGAIVSSYNIVMKGGILWDGGPVVSFLSKICITGGSPTLLKIRDGVDQGGEDGVQLLLVKEWNRNMLNVF